MANGQMGRGQRSDFWSERLQPGLMYLAEQYDPRSLADFPSVEGLMEMGAAKGPVTNETVGQLGADLASPFAAKIPAMLGMIAGRRAMTANLTNFDRAQRLDNFGKSKNEIYKQTGLYKGVDGQWKFEIPDTGATFPLEAKSVASAEPPPTNYLGRGVNDMGHPTVRTRWQGTLGEAMVHPELYKAYPELADMPVMISDDILPFGTQGQFTPAQGGMPGYIELANIPGASSTLLHEVQHAIQQMEKFGFGSEPKHATDILRKREKAWLDEVNRAQNTDEYKRAANIKLEMQNRLRDRYRAGEINDQQFDQLLDQIESEVGDKYPIYAFGSRLTGNPWVVDPSDYENYRRVSGEAEARLVQNRFANPERAKVQPPFLMYDVPAERQFNIFTGGQVTLPASNIMGTR